MPDFELKIYDNILTNNQIDSISKILLSTEIPWFFNESTVPIHEYETQANNSTYEYMMFVHKFRDDVGREISNFCGISDYVLKKFVEHTGIAIQKNYRTKMNLMPRYNKQGYNTPHIDILNMDHWVLIYYVCDADGDTHVFNTDETITKVTPKAGRYLFFNGNQRHASAHPILFDKRVVINYNLLLS